MHTCIFQESFSGFRVVMVSFPCQRPRSCSHILTPTRFNQLIACTLHSCDVLCSQLPSESLEARTLNVLTKDNWQADVLITAMQPWHVRTLGVAETLYPVCSQLQAPNGWYNTNGAYSGSSLVAGKVVSTSPWALQAIAVATQALIAHATTLGLSAFARIGVAGGYLPSDI